MEAIIAELQERLPNINQKGPFSIAPIVGFREGKRDNTASEAYFDLDKFDQQDEFVAFWLMSKLCSRAWEVFNSCGSPSSARTCYELRLVGQHSD
jgi:hypothetical protein